VGGIQERIAGLTTRGASEGAWLCSRRDA